MFHLLLCIGAHDRLLTMIAGGPNDNTQECTFDAI